VRVTAYAIVQRVPNATPRLRPSDNELCEHPSDAPAPIAPNAASVPALEEDEPESLADRVTALRAALAQTTWYLFNPDGWR